MKKRLKDNMIWDDDNEKNFDALYDAVIEQRWKQSLNNIRMKKLLLRNTGMGKGASRKSVSPSKSSLRLRRSRTRTSRRY
jgi:hypothetical protein